jgi:hypothetical protein
MIQPAVSISYSGLKCFIKVKALITRINTLLLEVNPRNQRFYFYSKEMR